MNALVKKEIRLLLPSFGFACVLALANLFFSNDPDVLLNSAPFIAGYLFCPAVAVMLALSSFGAEVGSGTFTLLLAQPVPRQKIWQTKIVLLAAALMIIVLLWQAAFMAKFSIVPKNHKPGDWMDFLVTAAMFGLVTFSGSLWTVLLLRQVAAAFWFTLLVPGVILIILTGLFAGQSVEFFEGMVVTALGLYCLAGFFFARWLFMRAQDVQWSGGTIVMPEMRGLGRIGSVSSCRAWRPRAALWWKEIQLHQSQFVMAFVLLVLHLGVLAVRHFYNLSHSRDLKFALEIFWGLWLVMPLLVGCAAVAEERKLGTLEGQLCLPVHRRTQFTTKLFVVLGLSVLLGAVMPLLLEGTQILPDFHVEQLGDSGFLLANSNNMVLNNYMVDGKMGGIIWLTLVNMLFALSPYLPFFTLAAVCAVVAAISFYISTLARNTLQSLAPAVLGLFVTWFLFFSVVLPQQFGLDFLWRGPLPYFVAVPLMLLALLALAFWNFKQVRTSLKMGGGNLLVIVAALVFSLMATSAVYHRGWEKLTPFEPAHGTARLSLADPAALTVESGEVSVRLPGGKIWRGQIQQVDNTPLNLSLGNLKFTVAGGDYVQGSNWLNVVRGFWFQQAGIKTDGTLWVSEKPVRLGPRGTTGWTAPKMTTFSQYGAGTNWSSIEWSGAEVLLAKTDGTLWRWGASPHFSLKHKPWPGLQDFTPYRLGTQTNWAEVFHYPGNYSKVLMRTTDNNFWTFAQYGDTNGQTLFEIEPGVMLQSVDDMGRKPFRSTTSVQHGLGHMIGVRNDGTFRIWLAEQLVKNKNPRYGAYGFRPVDLQIGTGTNWLAVAGGYEKVITLKDDGTLWLWDFRRNHPWADPGDGQRFAQEIQNTRPVRLGTHSDWVAISGTTALAADGSLWYWPLGQSRDDSLSYYDESPFWSLLEVSHKPQLLGNIFSQAD